MPIYAINNRKQKNDYRFIIFLNEYIKTEWMNIERFNKY